jgi:hypothetical protein
MSVLAIPKKGNRVNWGGIEPVIDKVVTVMQSVTDPVVSQSLNRAMRKSSEKQDLWIL